MDEAFFFPSLHRVLAIISLMLLLCAPSLFQLRNFCMQSRAQNFLGT